MNANVSKIKKVLSMTRLYRVLGILVAVLLWSSVTLAATLLPPGKQQFLDANGDPLAAGSVYFYIPNTFTPKNTWQNSGQTTLNTNPVVLDSGGYAVIYGSGSYRQIVKNSDGDTIWDQVTASSAEVTVDNIQYYATSVGGSANTITVSAITPSDYSLTTGKTLRFISPLTNTGSTTLNALTLGTVTIQRATNTGGVCSLAGGEIISGGVYDVLYNGTNYILLNPSVTDNPGETKPYAGSTTPNGYFLAYGQTVSRTTYSCLFSAISTSCGIGDGSTTFNICDLRGRVVAGVDNMGGSTASRITNAVAGIVGTTLAAAGGNQNYAAHTHTITDPGHTHSQTTYALDANLTAGGVQARATQTSGTTGSNTTGISINTSGTGTAANVQPTMMLNMIMRQ